MATRTMCFVTPAPAKQPSGISITTFSSTLLTPRLCQTLKLDSALSDCLTRRARTVQDLKSAGAKQEATIARQQKQIEALTAGLQKVSAQVQVSRPVPQTVANNQ